MKRRLVALGAIACVASAVLLAACSNTETPSPGGSTQPAGSADAYAVALPAFPAEPSEDDSDAWMKTLDENPLDPAFLESLSGFSYQTASAVLGDADENSTYSPISLYYALALATQGAAGQTADEMNAVLGAPDPAAVPLQAGNLYRVLYGDPFSKIDLANSIWMREGDEFEQSFIDTATQQFYATPFSVQFGTPEADKAIADWIAANTNGTIESQVQTREDQLMSIINTVYFKGSWSDQFDAASTKEDAFHTAEGDTTAEFMTQRLDKPREYVQTERYTRASLDFVGGAHDVRAALRGNEPDRYPFQRSASRRGLHERRRRCGLYHLHGSQDDVRHLLRSDSAPRVARHENAVFRCGRLFKPDRGAGLYLLHQAGELYHVG